jgi:autotransporter passenger strand-loop-strand repeat protein
VPRTQGRDVSIRARNPILPVSNGGTANSTTVSSGGSQTLSGINAINGGADAFNTVLAGGAQPVANNADAVGTSIGNNAVQSISSGGFANSTTVSSGGTQDIFVGAPRSALLQSVLDRESEIAVGAGRDRSRRVVVHCVDDSAACPTSRRLSPQWAGDDEPSLMEGGACGRPPRRKRCMGGSEAETNRPRDRLKGQP